MRVSRPVKSFLTYTLGNDLYIPITSRCNSKTLPETRGPNFVLPSSVVAALCRVRDAEEGTEQWTVWCNYLDTQEGPQKLPPPMAPVSILPPAESQKLTMETLQEEIDNYMESDREVSSIVMAGEGEPTLRLEEMLQLIKLLQTKHGDELPPVRVTTNGLNNVAEELHSGGVSKVSVALMTADPDQYDELMSPAVENGHQRVCQFIRDAVRVGLEVETTGVDRPDVDKSETEELSDLLKVPGSVRWRPWFG